MKLFYAMSVMVLLAVMALCSACSGSQRPTWELEDIDDCPPGCCVCCDDYDYAEYVDPGYVDPEEPDPEYVDPEAYYED
jgi:hypothetical protein